MLSTELAGGDELRLVSAEEVANLRAYSPWARVDTLDRESTSRIGTALSSDLIVLGSYATIGNPQHGQLRVDVRLQDCRTGEVVSEIAEIGATEDLFGIVSRIGVKLRNRLGIRRMPDSDEVLAQASFPQILKLLASTLWASTNSALTSFPCARFLERAIAAEPESCWRVMLSRTNLFMGRYEQAKTEAKQGLDWPPAFLVCSACRLRPATIRRRVTRESCEIYRVLFNLFPDSLDYGL